VGAVNCFQDISELKRVEAELHDSERRLRDLLEALPAAVYTTDTAGRLNLLQSGGDRALGVPAGAGNRIMVRVVAFVLAR
jgi:PAS domain-containing protein